MRWICIDQRMINLDHVVSVFPVRRVGKGAGEDFPVLRFEFAGSSIEFRFNHMLNLNLVFDALQEAVQCDPIMMVVPFNVTRSYEPMSRDQWQEELEK